MCQIFNKGKNKELAYGTKKGDKLSSQKYEQEMTVPYKNKETILLENKSPFTCMMKVKSTLTKITPPAMM